MRALHVFLAVLLLLPASGLARQKQGDSHAAVAAENQSRTASRSDDIQARRQDIARMKALVQQMQSNLAFVDSSQSPLKHQFQMEIDMWQMLITHMERRLAEPPAK